MRTTYSCGMSITGFCAAWSLPARHEAERTSATSATFILNMRIPFLVLGEFKIDDCDVGGRYHQVCDILNPCGAQIYNQRLRVWLAWVSTHFGCSVVWGLVVRFFRSTGRLRRCTALQKRRGRVFLTWCVQIRLWMDVLKIVRLFFYKNKRLGTFEPF